MHKLLVVEDIPETGRWLSGLLDTAFPEVVVEVCHNCHATSAYLQQNSPELALVDINLPDGNGLELIPVILQAAPQALVIITTILDDQENILTALQSGASGYMLKDLPDQQFIQKLRGILQGDPPLSPRVARTVLKYFNSYPNTAQPPVTQEASATEQLINLSGREQEVFVMIAKGLSRKEVANLLHLSENTIATHIRNVYRKLDISTRAEAAVEACRLGLINTMV